jgi:hypothetical protein
LVFTGLEYVEAMRNRTEQLGLFEALSDELFGEHKQPDGNVPVPAQDVYEIRHRKNRDGFDRSAIGCETTQSGMQGHSDGTIYKNAIGKVYTTSSRQARITQF